MTVVPTLANSGAHCLEVFPPAENMAISGFNEIACLIPITSKVELLKLIFLPTDFSEATA